MVTYWWMKVNWTQKHLLSHAKNFFIEIHVFSTETASGYFFVQISLWIWNPLKGIGLEDTKSFQINLQTSSRCDYYYKSLILYIRIFFVVSTDKYYKAFNPFETLEALAFPFWIFQNKGDLCLSICSKLIINWFKQILDGNWCYRNDL